MNIFAYLLSLAIAMGFAHFLKRRRNSKSAELSGGFSHYAGIIMPETELLQIVVLEELERCRAAGKRFFVPAVYRRRRILTAIAICVNFLVLILWYSRPATVIWCLLLALLYVWLYHRWEPVKFLCAEVRKQPDREISQVVSELTAEQSSRSFKIIGIAAFVLSFVIFIGCTINERFVWKTVDGGYSLSAYHPGLLKQSQQVEIPGTYQDQPVVAIGKGAFRSNSALRQVSIPNTVTLIDSAAFKGCSRLETIRLPEGLRTLNGESFMDCTSLRKIVIPEGVTEIRGNTFDGCVSLETVQLHDGILDIHAYAFRGCKALKAIDLPPKITEIHAYTFENCTSLEKIHIPVGVTRIAAHAFYGCSALSQVSVPETVKEIRSSAFRQCKSLQEIFLPKGVKVDEKAFKESPTEINISPFTDEESQKITKEAQAKEAPDILYFVYKKAAPEEVRGWDEKTVLIVDDPLFAKKLDNSEDLQAMNGYREVLAYLEAAQKAGFTEVIYAVYSPLATELTGELYFLRSDLTVKDMIADCHEGIAEEENG